MANEDYFTSTVDGARGFERMRIGRGSRYPEGYFPDAEYESSRKDDDDDEEEEDDCNCSDPGCPCGGRKIGGL